MSQLLMKKGAEADIYVTEWAGRKAISKLRVPKPYRHSELDSYIRKHRTMQEANLMSAAKKAGVTAPFIYFVDPKNAEIIMEFVEGRSAREVVSLSLCREIGRYSAMLHLNGIIHGDLTTSNFIKSETSGRLVLLDFGLAYYSDRVEDAATDIRLIKEIFGSAHVGTKGAFESFVKGYASVAGKKRTDRILKNVLEIERRGRYARVT